MKSAVSIAEINCREQSAGKIADDMPLLGRLIVAPELGALRIVQGQMLCELVLQCRSAICSIWQAQDAPVAQQLRCVCAGWATGGDATQAA